MTEYVPTTEEVREAYVVGVDPEVTARYRAEFDRWLTEYTRVKQAEAWERGHAAFEEAWESDNRFPYDYATDNPYWKEKNE